MGFGGRHQVEWFLSNGWAVCKSGPTVIDPHDKPSVTVVVVARKRSPPQAITFAKLMILFEGCVSLCHASLSTAWGSRKCNQERAAARDGAGAAYQEAWSSFGTPLPTAGVVIYFRSLGGGDPRGIPPWDIAQ